jgi:hypothetical protein
VDESDTIRRLVDEGRIAVVGTLYDIGTGKMDFMLDEAIGRVTETETKTKTQAEPTLGAA